MSMTKKEKLLEKFMSNPSSLHYSDIEKILIEKGFEKIPAKGSHQKFKHPSLSSDLIIPIHNNDCKEFYKKLAMKIIKENTL